jgi:hypothetical protein
MLQVREHNKVLAVEPEGTSNCRQDDAIIDLKE